MWFRFLQPLIIGLSVAAVTFIACLALSQFFFALLPLKSQGRLGIDIYSLFAVLMLFCPSFSAGYVARKNGAFYGILLSGIPMLLLSLVNYGFPIGFYIMFISLAVVGGHCGQLLALRKRLS
ncbi:hypothetical protein AAFF27_08885 [Xylophilus sp. GW821-FHT01B05]